MYNWIMYDWRAEYDSLVQQLPAIMAAASGWDTGRPEDDLFSKVAILAFGRHASHDEFGWDHLLEVRRWREGDYSDEELAEDYTPEESRRLALLACAWLGTVLALFHNGTVDEPEAFRAYALLPAYVLMDSGVMERDWW